MYVFKQLGRQFGVAPPATQPSLLCGGIRPLDHTLLNIVLSSLTKFQPATIAKQMEELGEADFEGLLKYKDKAVSAKHTSLMMD